MSAGPQRPTTADGVSCRQLRSLLELSQCTGTQYDGLSMLSAVLPPERSSGLNAAMASRPTGRPQGMLGALRRVAEPGLDFFHRSAIGRRPSAVAVRGADLSGLHAVAQLFAEEEDAAAAASAAAAAAAASPAPPPAQKAAPPPAAAPAAPAAEPAAGSAPAAPPQPPAPQRPPAHDAPRPSPAADSEPAAQRPPSRPPSSSDGRMQHSGAATADGEGPPPARPRVRRNSSASGLPSAYLSLVARHADERMDGAAARRVLADALLSKQGTPEAGRSSAHRSPSPPLVAALGGTRRIRGSGREQRTATPQHEDPAAGVQARAAPQPAKQGRSGAKAAIDSITNKQGQLEREIQHIQQRRKEREVQRVTRGGGTRKGRGGTDTLPPIHQPRRGSPDKPQSSGGAAVRSAQPQEQGLPQLNEGTRSQLISDIYNRYLSSGKW